MNGLFDIWHRMSINVMIALQHIGAQQYTLHDQPFIEAFLPSDAWG